MSSEAKVSVLTAFVDHRVYILNVLNVAEIDRDKELKQEPPESYLSLLMLMPVSKLSRFSDSVWDFNDDYPNAARNVQGAKLRINLSKHAEIPRFVLTELKIILQLALLNPSIFKKPRKNGRGGKVSVKANTIFQAFNYGLAFINELFKQANEELGKEYVQEKIETLSDILPEFYYKAAENYGRIKDAQLDSFFDYIRSPASQKYVFKNPVHYVELSSLNWKNLPQKKNKKQVFQNDVFEKLSKNATMIVVDFLNSIGDKPEDAGALERLNASEDSWSSHAGINKENLVAYTALRLRHKGYSHSAIKERIEPYDWMFNKKSELLSVTTLRKHLISKGVRINDVREYINLVDYSCTYIVGQYSGMRPSELAEVRTPGRACLVEEDQCWVIKSTLKKGVGEEATGLFDDKWVAIPIVRDAISAASHISKIKQSPYLLSNVDTVAPGEKAAALQSSGITHQMNILIKRFFGEEAVKDIAFNSYMMRHTLAYQLFRADVGLPLISFQLKHFVDSVSKYTSTGATSSVTLGYGEIGELLAKGAGRNVNDKSLRRNAELESVRAANDPNGVYYGGKAVEHKERLIKMFDGYMASGYTEEEVYEAMADQGVAVANMGQGMCYGGRAEDFDESLPCIGSLRCNPARCKEAIVTTQHAPKWREVYVLNKANLNKPEYKHNRAQIEAAMLEAKMVLEDLGEEVEI